MAADEAGVEAHPPQHGDEHLDDRGTSVVFDSSPELIASLTAHVTNSRELSSESFLLARSSGCRWASNTEVTRNAAAARSFESACTAALMNASSRPTRVVAALRPLRAGSHHQRVGLLDDFAVQHPLAGEIMVDRGAGQIGPDGDRLEGRSVVPQFAENLAGGAQNALTCISRLSCWGTTRPPLGGMRHS